MAFLVCFLVGFLMCVPIGPINVWVMHTFLRKTALHAFVLALGGASMDFLYFYTILSGLSFIEFTPFWNQTLKFIGIFLILILGIKELFSAKDIVIEKELVTKGKAGLLGSFLIGALLYVSNPTLVVTMSGLGAFIKSLKLFELSGANNFWGALGLSMGAMFWFSTLIYLVKKYEEIIKSKYMNLFSQVSGVLMILFSSIMAFKLIF